MCKPVEEQILEAVKVLVSGGVIVYPTDTVYGIGAFYDDESAVNRIYSIKERQNIKALPLIIGSTAQLDTLVDCIPEVAKKLINAFWPGALTLVFKRSISVADFITGGKNTVAIRVPDHYIPKRISFLSGKAICATSANIAGRESAKTARQAFSELGQRVDYIIDGGKARGGVESTVVDVSGGNANILREGAISQKSIEKHVILEKKGAN